MTDISLCLDILFMFMSGQDPQVQCNGSKCLYCTQQKHKYLPRYIKDAPELKSFDRPLFASSEAASGLLAGLAIVYICWARAKARLLVAGDK